MERVLITGATGFIGGRLAEVLCDRGVEVHGLVRTWSRAARLARLPVRMMPGDIGDAAAVQAAVAGCDTVFHCAIDHSVAPGAHGASNTAGTANVLEAAKAAGVRRVVFTSSIAVYSYTPAADAEHETGRRVRSGNPYGDGKIEAEDLALRFHREQGLPVAVLRPTLVYGPFGQDFTISTAQDVRRGRMVLVDEGAGICNCVYVDNVVQALILAAEHPAAPGEVFHVSDAKPVTWKAFAEGHARALGEQYVPLPSMTASEIAAARERLRREGSSLRQARRALADPHLRQTLAAIPAFGRAWRIAKSVAGPLIGSSKSQPKRSGAARSSAAAKPQEPPPVPSPGRVGLYTNRVVHRIDKARNVLGYEPAVGFAEGMARTAAWLRWARL